MERILPAYPLMVKDPYFSFWAKTENFAEENVVFWTGAEKGMYGIVKVSGTPYRFLGKAEGAESAVQTQLRVTAFTTDCTFRAGNATLSVRFVSPLPPDDLATLSCPVCYMEYTVEGADDTEVILALHENVCYNEGFGGEMRGGKLRAEGFEAAFMGLGRQAPLSHNEDVACADWGYFYLSGEHTAYEGEDGNRRIVSRNRKKTGVVMVAYDDIASVRYFGETLRGYYAATHTIVEALCETYARIQEIDAALEKHDERLRDCAAPYEGYYPVLVASLRQSLGAHKLVRNAAGEVLFLSKECYSNGCMATVDVTYPSAPLYLLYNPELLRGMLRPVLAFAEMPVWTFGFAPHDVGSYPIACGQVYGADDADNALEGNAAAGGYRQTKYDFYLLPPNASPYTPADQMPIEESADILILLAAIFRADGDLSLFRRHGKTLGKWAQYLVEFGLKPENQLCTDDFAGHSVNNLNLAIKATVGIACYAVLCDAAGKPRLGTKYRTVAEAYAREIAALGDTRTHLPLTWDSAAESFGLKYNLAFDKILGLQLFPQSLCEKEVDCYLAHADRYGVPLDTRATYTKADWLIWAACLTDDTDKRNRFVAYLRRYLRESPDRIPFGDWYDAVTAQAKHFRNRTVVGGCFMLAAELRKKIDNTQKT